MNIIIKKFGGTSVSSIDRIERAISYIKKARKDWLLCCGSCFCNGQGNR